MPVAKTIARQLENASWIRRMFEEGVRLKRERGADAVFDFSLGNPDIEPPPAVLDALRRVVAGNPPGSHGYMPNPGYAEVREAVAGKLHRETGLNFTAEDIFMTVGAAGACNVILKSLLDPGDEVLVLAPYFAEYQFYIANHGGRMVPVETDDSFLPDVERIAAAITPRTRALILNTPNNPTGCVYPERVLRDLDEMLKRAGQPITVISDEPYKSFVYDGQRQPEVASSIAHTAICNSWSKSLGLAGERIGYLALSPRLQDRAELRRACAFSNRTLGFVNAPAIWQRVMLESLDESDRRGNLRAEAERSLRCAAGNRVRGAPARRRVLRLPQDAHPRRHRLRPSACRRGRARRPRHGIWPFGLYSPLTDDSAGEDRGIDRRVSARISLIARG